MDSNATNRTPMTEIRKRGMTTSVWRRRYRARRGNWTMAAVVKQKPARGVDGFPPHTSGTRGQWRLRKGQPYPPGRSGGYEQEPV
jgi:hypothetical protein